jgi:transcriptional regulator with XRE-family HTH domain
LQFAIANVNSGAEVDFLVRSCEDHQESLARDNREHITPMDQTAQNLQLQTDLYGEPLGDLVRRIAGRLGLTQARVAEVIGLSAPMLSQLMSAQRVKIGNPGVVFRLQALDEFAGQKNVEHIGPDVIEIVLAEISGTTGAFTKSSSRATASWTSGATGPPLAQPMTSRDVVRQIQDLFREVASAEEIQRAAELISAESPRLAELLTVYGTGRTDDAVAHFERRSG